jgi:hypothetical protein
VPDEFERQYLGGDEAVHREKRISRGTFGGLAALSGGLGLLGTLSLAAFASGDPQGLGGALILGGLAAMNAFLAVTLSVARVAVTPRDIRFMVGLRSRVVPMSAIGETSVGTLDPKTLRNDVAADRAEMASIFSSIGGYVRLAWTDETGRARVSWIGSDQPEVLRAAIERHRRPTPTRVAENESENERENERESENENERESAR